MLMFDRTWNGTIQYTQPNRIMPLMPCIRRVTLDYVEVDLCLQRQFHKGKNWGRSGGRGQCITRFSSCGPSFSTID